MAKLWNLRMLNPIVQYFDLRGKTAKTGIGAKYFLMS
jgi:hypothetical protein